MNKSATAALQLRKKGMSVIPVGRNKRPMIKWEKYQSEKAEESDIRKWYKKWPDVNIAIVTGKISGISVLDADSEEAFNLIDGFLPESFITPTAKTPNGKHVYFKYTSKLGTAAGLTSGLDIRNDGGYIVTPPGQNTNGGKYEWLISPFESPLAPIPDILLDTLLQFFDVNSFSIKKTFEEASSLEEAVHTGLQLSTTVHTLLSEGTRDNDLFHLANYLVRGGMGADEIRKYLHFFGNNCTPPFPEKEIETKIQSALKRSGKRDQYLAQEVKEYVLSTTGVFLSTDIHNCLQLSTREERKNLSTILSRLRNEGIIEKHGTRNGCFRRIEKDLNIIDLKTRESNEFRVKLPLNLEEFIITRPKNTIIIAGEWEVGKTCFCLNIAKLNIGRGFPIRYISTEMGPDEIRARLMDFEPDMPFDDWLGAVEFVDAEDKPVQDQIIEDGLNIIDYLEIYDKFYLIGEELAKVYKKLKKGIAIVSIQKDPAKEYGLGAMHALHKPRLYVTLSRNPPEGSIAKIVKAKSWRNSKRNPRGYQCDFKIFGGSKISRIGDWYKE